MCAGSARTHCLLTETVYIYSSPLSLSLYSRFTTTRNHISYRKPVTISPRIVNNKATSFVGPHIRQVHVVNVHC